MSGGGDASGGGGGSDDAATRGDYQKLWAEVQAMPAEQQKAVAAAAYDELLRRCRVKVDSSGKVQSLRALRRRVEVQQREQDSGAYEESSRSIPRWQAQLMIPGEQLRRGAHKMQLRHWEEAELELDRFGCGEVRSPRPLVGKLGDGGRRVFSWGLYARAEPAERLLGPAWSGRDPAKVLADERFYWDVLRHCCGMEMTLMVLTERRLPLAATRAALASCLEGGMQRLAGEGGLTSADRADLKDFLSLFDDERVKPAGWMGRDGCVKEGTHFVLTATPRGELAAEAITPGPLRERKTSFIGVARSQLVTGAVLDLFLGPEALDAAGRTDVGHGMLWVANGFRFRPWEARPGQYAAVPGPDGTPSFPSLGPEDVEVLSLPLRPGVFQLAAAAVEPQAAQQQQQQQQPLRRMLLGGVRRALQRGRRDSADAAAAAQ